MALLVDNIIGRYKMKPLRNKIVRKKHVRKLLKKLRNKAKEENLKYLEGKGIEAYIKPANYEQRKKKKFAEDISKKKNMDYDAERDFYICKNSRQIKNIGKKKRKTASGYRARREKAANEPKHPDRRLLWRYQRVQWLYPLFMPGNGSPICGKCPLCDGS